MCERKTVHSIPLQVNGRSGRDRPNKDIYLQQPTPIGLPKPPPHRKQVMELVDELCWILEDSSRHIAGRIHAATQRYLSNLLPPLANAMVRRLVFGV